MLIASVLNRFSGNFPCTEALQFSFPEIGKQNKLFPTWYTSEYPLLYVFDWCNKTWMKIPRVCGVGTSIGEWEHFSKMFSRKYCHLQVGAIYKDFLKARHVVTVLSMMQYYIWMAGILWKYIFHYTIYKINLETLVNFCSS